MTSLTFGRATVFAIACGALLTACGSGEPAIGPPSELRLAITTGLTAPANTVVPPFQITVLDAHGHKLPGVTVNFEVTAGNGFINNAAFTSAVSDANGNVTVQGWNLGKLAVTQTLTATTAAATLAVNASVTTSYQIVVRFWGDQTNLTDANKALFINAAARIKGIVTGDVQDVSTPQGGFDLAQCGITGQPILNEVIDDVVIYASIQPIDGSGGSNGNILAQAGPCAGRTTVTGYHTALGVMEFDSFDFASLAGPGGSLQDVVTHEMMHVLGFGVYWDAPSQDNPGGRDLLTGQGLGDPRYNGTAGRQGCVAVGGTTTCASSVPAENVGGEGSENSHWRETTFNNELMTSRLNPGSNAISAMTIGSFVDLGFAVNSADNDAYTIPGGSILASKSFSSLLGPANPRWERVLQPSFVIENGRLRDLRPSRK